MAGSNPRKMAKYLFYEDLSYGRLILVKQQNVHFTRIFE